MHVLHRKALTKYDLFEAALSRRLLPAALVALLGSNAHAQSTGASADDELAEIVVTAEKRDSTVQRTPISMTALSGAALEAQGTSDLVDIIHEVPGISIRTSGPGQTELEMRGLSSSAGAAPTVGFYLGETALTPAANTPLGKTVIDPDLFDLNRVEVLRGPQGTLYGSGSMGGTVKLVPNAPDATHVEGRLDGTLSGTPGGGIDPSINGLINLPLVDDRVALRLVFTEKYRSGWIDRDVVDDFPQPVDPCGIYGAAGCVRGNLADARVSKVVPDVNWYNLTSGRAALLIMPAEGLTVTTTAMYQVNRLGGYDNYDQSPGNTHAHYQPFDIAEPFRDRFGFLETSLNYDLGFAQLTSASSYWSRSQRQTQDVSEALNSFMGAFFGAFGFYPTTYTEADTSHQFSQEVRLSSKGDGRLSWLVGGYYNQFSSTYGASVGNPVYAGLSTGGAAANPDGLVYAAHNPYGIKQYAVFSDVGYNFLDTLKLDLGLRWYRFDTDALDTQSGIGTLTGNAQPSGLEIETRNSGFNPKATLSYQPTGDLDLYTTVSRGFRPGGVNLPIPQNFGCTLTNESYGPDHIWNYEVGEKARLADRRVTLNTDFYYIKWSQAQQTVTQSCGYAVYTNAGDAKAYGPEAELSVALLHALSVNLTGTYTKAFISRVDPAVAATGSILEGSPILNIPNVTVSASLDYKRPVSDRYDLSARLTESYVGRSTDVSLTEQELSPYSLLGTRIGLIGPSWSGYLFVDNLTDKVAQLSVNTTAFSFPIPSLTRVVTNQPRTIGLNLAYRF